MGRGREKGDGKAGKGREGNAGGEEAAFSPLARCRSMGSWRRQLTGEWSRSRPGDSYLQELVLRPPGLVMRSGDSFSSSSVPGPQAASLNWLAASQLLSTVQARGGIPDSARRALKELLGSNDLHTCLLALTLIDLLALNCPGGKVRQQLAGSKWAKKLGAKAAALEPLKYPEGLRAALLQLLADWALVFAGQELGNAAEGQCRALAGLGLAVPAPSIVAYQRAPEIDAQSSPNPTATAALLHGLDFAAHFGPGSPSFTSPSTSTAGPRPSSPHSRKASSPTNLKRNSASAVLSNGNGASSPYWMGMRHTVSGAELSGARSASGGGAKQEEDGGASSSTSSFGQPSSRGLSSRSATLPTTKAEGQDNARSKSSRTLSALVDNPKLATIVAEIVAGAKRDKAVRPDAPPAPPSPVSALHCCSTSQLRPSAPSPLLINPLPPPNPSPLSLPSPPCPFVTNSFFFLIVLSVSSSPLSFASPSFFVLPRHSSICDHPWASTVRFPCRRFPAAVDLLSYPHLG